MTVSGKRGRHEYLTDDELIIMRRDLNSGMTQNAVAAKHRCSSGVVKKYCSLWACDGSLLRGRKLDRETRKYHMVERPAKIEPAPHALSWVTKEMLTGGNARIACRK